MADWSVGAQSQKVASTLPRHARLGELLRFLGLLSGFEVERAVRRQSSEGGRLGTCLLDGATAAGNSSNPNAFACV